MDTLLDKIIRELRLQKILPLIPVNGTILDLGSGDPPHLLLKIERKINAGFGIDKQLKPQRLTSKIKLIEQDLDRNPSLPFEDNFFDVVTMTAVIEHLTRPTVVLGEVKRVLKKGGLLILTTPAPASKPLLEFLAFRLKIISQKEIENHKHYFSKRELLSILTDLDFQNITCSYFELGFNQICQAKKR